MALGESSPVISKVASLFLFSSIGPFGFSMKLRGWIHFSAVPLPVLFERLLGQSDHGTTTRFIKGAGPFQTLRHERIWQF